MNSRTLGWNIAASIGYSFILTFLTFIISVIVKFFYPPYALGISPFLLLSTSLGTAIVQLLILLALIAFAFPVRTKIAGIQLLSIRYLSLVTGISYLFFSMLPYAIKTPYIQTFLGLVIAFNIINGIFSGSVVSIIQK